MPGILKIDVDVNAKKAMVRFDPKKAEVSEIVKRIDATRFTASLGSPVAQVLENPVMTVRAEPDAIEYAPGAKGKITVSARSVDNARMAELKVGGQPSWPESDGQWMTMKSTGFMKFPVNFEIPEKPGDTDLKVEVKVAYRPQEGGGDAKTEEVTLRVPIRVSSSG